MDVLGFTDEIMNAFSKGKGLQLLDSFYSVHEKQIKGMSQLGLPKWSAIKVFTDNIVLGFPFWSSDGEAEFGAIIYNIAEYQYEMAKAGFFVRGALTIGDLFMDENTAFGPAIIEAYRLEQGKARDPRIILSEKVKELVFQHLNYYGDPFDSPQNRCISEASDRMLFVNYLDEANLGEYEGEHMDWLGLKEHKKHIEKNLLRFRKNPRVWSKYFWLANYHNWFVNLFSDVEGFSPDLEIDKKIARTQPTRLIKKRKNTLGK
jgi:hypothetical protein